MGEVSIRGLTKRYGTTEAACGISFSVTAGEIFGLLGPNGAGKTTILECILGLRRPDAGAILIEGVDAIAHPEQAKERVGAQLQDAALQDKITPRQALRLFASFYRKPARIEDLIERFALRGKADASFDSLSGGQKQRLFLALAFVNDPSVVVLDEPTAGLDPQARRELHRIIRELRAAGRTVLLSTHYIEEAEALCDRVGILVGGRLVAVASPAEFIAGTKSPSRVAVKTARPIDAAAVLTLAGVISVQSQESGWSLGTINVSQTIVELVRCLEASKNDLLDLRIHRPSLEDVFIELTGRVWSAVPEEEEP
jgi:ABC-2 type transport system ATP-binding protein